MLARIYTPAKTAMQSGLAKTGKWMLEFEREKARKIEPLMGYTSSSDMKAQIRMEFPTLEAAKAFCEREGIPFTVQSARIPRSRRAMAYSDNFKYNRQVPWTH